MKLGSAWRKAEEGVDIGKRCHLGGERVCVSVFGLQDPFLQMHQHHKSRNSASPSQRLLIFCSLRFMSKQDNSSSGGVFFPPFLGSLHTNISGFVAGNYIFLLWHKDAKPLWCCAVLHGNGLVQRFRRRPPGFDGTPSRVSRKKRWLKGNFGAAAYYFIQTFLRLLWEDKLKFGSSGAE